REEPDGAVVAEYEVALQRGELAAPVANARYDHRPGLRAPLVLDHRIDQRLTPLPRVRTISGRVEEVVGVEAMRPLLDVPPVVATGFHPSDLLVAGLAGVGDIHVAGFEVEGHPVWISEPVGPDLLPGVAITEERIVLGDAVRVVAVDVDAENAAQQG